METYLVLLPALSANSAMTRARVPNLTEKTQVLETRGGHLEKHDLFRLVVIVHCLFVDWRHRGELGSCTSCTPHGARDSCFMSQNAHETKRNNKKKHVRKKKGKKKHVFLWLRCHLDHALHTFNWPTLNTATLNTALHAHSEWFTFAEPVHKLRSWWSLSTWTFRLTGLRAKRWTAYCHWGRIHCETAWTIRYPAVVSNAQLFEIRSPHQIKWPLWRNHGSIFVPLSLTVC